MYILSINTSFKQGSIALLENKKVIGEYQWLDKPHSEEITPALEKILSKAKIQIQQLHTIVCGQGPGSFTGIRVGLSLAKSLSYSLGIPLVVVDDCFSLALRSPQTNLPFVSLIDAQKNKLFCGIYSFNNDQWHVETPPSLVTTRELQSLLAQTSYYCCGNGYALLKSLGTNELLIKLNYLGDTFSCPSAAVTAIHVGSNWNRYSQGNWKNAHPLYLRKSSAEEVLAAKSK